MLSLLVAGGLMVAFSMLVCILTSVIWNVLSSREFSVLSLSCSFVFSFSEKVCLCYALIVDYAKLCVFYQMLLLRDVSSAETFSSFCFFTSTWFSVFYTEIFRVAGKVVEKDSLKQCIAAIGVSKMGSKLKTNKTEKKFLVSLTSIYIQTSKIFVFKKNILFFSLRFSPTWQEQWPWVTSCLLTASFMKGNQARLILIQVSSLLNSASVVLQLFI